MNYQESLDYILGTPNPGGVYERNVMETLMHELGDPHKDCRYVHIAGTNGKGSTAAMLAAILRRAGYRTGLYTSPYIVRFNERMQVDGVEISDEQLCELTEYVRLHADAMQEHPSEFEMVTATAMAWSPG